MAKVKGGLFSLEASGKFADAMVFDKRGYIREYKIPSNPQTAAQGNQRQKFLGIQKLIKSLNADYINYAKIDAPLGYRWSSWLAQQMSGRLAGALTSLATATSDEAAWTTAAQSQGFVYIADLDYASDPALSPGALLYILATTVFIDLRDPMGLGNPATVADPGPWAAAVLV